MNGDASNPQDPPETPEPVKESPFDPFLVRLLVAVHELDGGYSPQSHNSTLASQLDVDPAFIEALTLSARRRSLIEPFYPPGPRNAMRWRVSARGQQFLATRSAPESISDELSPEGNA